MNMQHYFQQSLVFIQFIKQSGGYSSLRNTFVVSGSGMCKVGFTGVYAPRIMAGTDQKNSYVVLSCHGAEVVSYGPDCSADSCFRSYSSLPGG